MTEYLYRAFGSVRWEAPSDNPWNGEKVPVVEVCVDRLPILRHTPKGAWVRNHITGKKVWVATQGRKRYAQNTPEEAMESLKERNRWRLIHLRRQTREAEAIKATLHDETPPTVVHLRDGSLYFGE